MTRLECIVCPIDFSEAAEHALRYAVDLARIAGASVVAVHVYETPLQWVPPGVAYSAEAPGGPFDFERVKQTLREQLDALLAKVDTSGVKVHGNLVAGTPAQSIVEHAASLDADLIVMSTHGRRGFDRLLLGSVAERVVRLSKCPVLTLRAPHTTPAA
jgi:nucleotide-binding universal stress UspA family protein